MNMTPRRLVLIADDNRDTREMYTHYLGMIGYVVETAADGREAVLKARLLRPAVIVLDLGMPGMDGWEAMRLIRADAKTATTPIIVLTGHDLKDYLKPAALTLGASNSRARSAPTSTRGTPRSGARAWRPPNDRSGG